MAMYCDATRMHLLFPDTFLIAFNFILSIKNSSSSRIQHRTNNEYQTDVFLDNQQSSLKLVCEYGLCTAHSNTGEWSRVV